MLELCLQFNNTIKFIAFNLWIWEINLMWREKKSIKLNKYSKEFFCKTWNETHYRRTTKAIDDLKLCNEFLILIDLNAIQKFSLYNIRNVKLH